MLGPVAAYAFRRVLHAASALLHRQRPGGQDALK